MAKKKKNPLSWLTQVFDMFGDLFDMVKAESEVKLEEIKAKVKYYMLVYGMFLVALFFIFIGLIKYLAETFVFASEGIAFMAVGAIMIVVLAAYSLIKQM